VDNFLWDYFKTWTFTLLKDAENQQAYTVGQLNSACQHLGQFPALFDAYLALLERQLEEQPDSERAYFFLAKLELDF
jgi:hypothetical protein